jgi:hypothetical protein
MIEDIATRLLTWTHAVDAPPASDLMDEAAREIVELRNRLAELSVIVRTCRSRSECVKAAKRLAPVTIAQQLVNGFHRVELAWREMRQPTLTGEERVAVEWAARAADKERQRAADAADRGYKPDGGGDPRVWAEGHSARAATLRKLLERMT